MVAWGRARVQLKEMARQRVGPVEREEKVRALEAVREGGGGYERKAVRVHQATALATGTAAGDH